jgi:hypothetical protein
MPSVTILNGLRTTTMRKNCCGNRGLRKKSYILLCTSLSVTNPVLHCQVIFGVNFLYEQNVI